MSDESKTNEHHVREQSYKVVEYSKPLDLLGHRSDVGKFAFDFSSDLFRSSFSFLLFRQSMRHCIVSIIYFLRLRLAGD